METRFLLTVFRILLLLAALANASSGRKQFPGDQQGNHHHHHQNKYGGGEGDGTAKSANVVTFSDGDAQTAAESANSSGVVAGEPDVIHAVAFDVPDLTQPPVSEINELMNTTSHWFTDLLKNVSAYFPVNVEYARNVGNYCNPVEYNHPYYNVPSIIISAVLLVLGGLFCYFGYRLIKINLFLIGFVFAGFVTYSFVLAILGSVQQVWVLYLALALGLIAGVAMGIVTICIYHVGLFLVGGSIGFLFAWIFLSVIDVEFFQDRIYIPILIAIVAGVVSGVITLLYPKYLVILGTSAVGAFQIIWALDYYIELGQAIYYLALYAVDRGGLSLCWYSWVIVALCPVLFASGILIQLLVTGRKHNHKDDFKKGICCGLCDRCKGQSREDYVPLKDVK